MPRRKTAGTGARKANAKQDNGARLGFEEKLWQAADKLRGHMDAAEYKHVVLGLIFLKYISDAFEEKRQELENLTADPASEYYAREEQDRYGVIEDRDEYLADNIFWVPQKARWGHLQNNAKQPEIGVLIDDAMEAIEKENPVLKGVLPKDYARPALDKQRLGELIDLIGTIGLGDRANRSKDILGRVYEYFLGQFASAEGKKGGQFYTPRCVVQVLVEMLSPYKGRVFDPCCGSGGMFVQSETFVEAHGGRRDDISVYGQESNPTTWRLAKMNLAIRGIECNLGAEPADSFHRDLHKALKADYLLANPPFNMSDWGGERLRDDVRWKFGAPPVGNANYAWVQHFIHHLAPHGIAGFVLANGSMSSNTSGEGEIRKNIIEADLVDCMVALPGQLFYSTPIPVCLWFVSRDKSNGRFRKRTGETLFIDARNLGTLIDRVHRELTPDDIQKIAGTYHLWRGDPHPSPLPAGEGVKTAYRGGFDFSGLVETARELRQKETPAETAMWELLRNRRFMDLKFRRQHQFGKYVVDFYCDEKKAVVELDGPVHNSTAQAKKDKTRDAYMKALGLTVIRIKNEEFLSDPQSTLQRIAEAFISSTDSAQDSIPSPSGGVRDHSDIPSPSGRGARGEGVAIYRDIPGFCKSATLDDIRQHNYVLTPGRYVGAEEVEDDGVLFEDKMQRLTAELREQTVQARKLDEIIWANLEDIGYGQ